jgi:hypothetical protein
MIIANSLPECLTRNYCPKALPPVNGQLRTLEQQPPVNMQPRMSGEWPPLVNGQPQAAGEQTPPVNGQPRTAGEQTPPVNGLPQASGEKSPPVNGLSKLVCTFLNRNENHNEYKILIFNCNYNGSN